MKKNVICIIFLIYFFLSIKANAITDTPSPALDSQSISVEFSITGIGSTGNPDPQTKIRKIELLFYDSQINAYDRSVKPIFSFSAEAEYDANQESAFYGKFVNENIELTDEVPSGNYQIVLKVEKVLPRLAGVSEGGVGGEIFEIGEFSSDKIVIAEENLLPGDIHPVPSGDLILDTFDYNLLAACFGTSDSASSSCADKKSADLDDNGVLDGADYNLMVASVRELSRLGFPVPILGSISPTRTIVIPTPAKEADKKADKKEVSSQNTESAESGGSLWIILFALILLVISIFVIIKRKKVKNYFSAMVKKKSKKEKISENTNASSDTGNENKEEKIDKEYFVKKQAFDDKNKVTVLTLTDDSGPTLGYFAKENIQDGFAKVKGTLKKEGDKVYVDVSDISPVDSS